MSGDRAAALSRGCNHPSEVEPTLFVFLVNPFFTERETFGFPRVLVRTTADTSVSRAVRLGENVHQAGPSRSRCQRKHIL